MCGMGTDIVCSKCHWQAPRPCALKVHEGSHRCWLRQAIQIAVRRGYTLPRMRKKAMKAAKVAAPTPKKRCELCHKRVTKSKRAAVSCLKNSAVSSGARGGRPVVSSAPAVSNAPEAGHAAAVSGDGEAAADAEGAAPPVCSQRKRRRGKQPAKETCACIVVCMLIATE